MPEPQAVPEDMHLPCDLTHDEIAMVLNYRVEEGHSLPEALTTNTGDQVRTLYANALKKFRLALGEDPEARAAVYEMFQRQELTSFTRELEEEGM